VRHISPKDAADLDAIETREWLDSIDYVCKAPAESRSAAERAYAIRQAEWRQVVHREHFTSDTIPADEQASCRAQPRRAPIKVSSRDRAAMVYARTRRRKESAAFSFAWPLPLYEVNPLFRGPASADPDVIFFRDMPRSGIYARAYLKDGS
jgi:pyruvate dehydrogenase complex dehydrogenase (E1) component